MQPTQLDQLLKFLTDTLAQGKDFTVEQAPQFVRELLVWQFAEAAIWMAVWCTLALLAATVGVVLVKGLAKQDRQSDETVRLWGVFIRGLSAVVAVIAISSNGWDMVKIKVAPRVVIVEMVRNLIASPR